MINLTEEELTKLREAVNDSAEQPPELAGRLFPSFMEKLAIGSKFDFEARIRIPTLEYAGKRQEGVILAGAALLGQSAPLQILNTFGEPAEDGWRNMIIQRDNLQFLKTVFLNQDGWWKSSPTMTTKPRRPKNDMLSSISRPSMKGFKRENPYRRRQTAGKSTAFLSISSTY